jgi:hypothetical protein
VRESRTLRAMWRALETGPRHLLNGHEEGNLGYKPRRCLRAAAPVLDPTEHASDMPIFGTNSAAQTAKHVAQRPDHEFLFFSLLPPFTSYGGGLGSSHLDNVVR